MIQHTKLSFGICCACVLGLRTTPLLVFFTNKRTHVKTYIIAGISLARTYLKIQYDKYHVVTVAMTNLQVRRFVGEEHQQRRWRSTFLTRIMWVSMVPYSKEMYGGVQDANSVCSMRWLHLTLRTTPLLVVFTNKRTHVKTYIIAGISLARKYLKIQYDKYHVVTVAMTHFQVAQGFW